MNADMSGMRMGGYSGGTQSSAPLMGSSVSEMLQVPEQLLPWVSSSEILPTLLAVKKETNVNYINIVKNNGSISLLIDAPSPFEANMATKLLE